MRNRTANRRGVLGWSGAALAAVACCVSLSTTSKPDLPVARIPAGFTVNHKADSAAMVNVAASKPHGVKACIYVDPDIHLGYGWAAMAESAAQTVIQGLIRQEQETSTVGGIKTEPAGQEGLDGGTLLYKKTTLPQIGTSCPPWVTYTGTWAGTCGDGVLIVSVGNVPNSKESIKGLIDAMVK